MLAETFERGKHRVAGMFFSEKLDGMRCIWIPHTRNIPVKAIPFANREKDKREHVATGLWTRYGKVIHCPDWFTAGFPQYALDGELYMGRGRFQQTMSVTKQLEPDDADWRYVQYKVFDAPLYATLFQNGRINNPIWSKSIKLAEMEVAFGETFHGTQESFEQVYNRLARDMKETEFLSLHKQVLTVFNTPKAMDQLDALMYDVLNGGGEGGMLRNPASPWEPIRSRHLMKVVPVHDAEGTILDFTAGEGKLLGMFGSALVRWERGTFNLSGFTDAERGLPPDIAHWARNNPGELFSSCSILGDNNPRNFSVGDTITTFER